VYLGVFVPDSVPQVGWLPGREIVFWVPLDSGPRGPILVEPVENLVVVLFGEGSALPTVRLLERTMDPQLSQVLQLLAVCPGLSPLGRRVGIWSCGWGGAIVLNDLVPGW